MPTAFGKFLEFSVPTPDIKASLEFYQRLGFSEIPVGDIWPYYYAVLTDGQIAIGLHAERLEEPALAFVCHDISARLDQPLIRVAEREFARLGADEFNELGLREPGGCLIVMLEARTFSMAEFSVCEAPVIGQIAEISLGCADPESYGEYWETAGFALGFDGEDAQLTAPGIALGLRVDLRPTQLSLRIKPADAGLARDRLDALDCPQRKIPGGMRVTAPEGTWLDIEL